MEVPTFTMVRGVMRRDALAAGARKRGEALERAEGLVEVGSHVTDVEAAAALIVLQDEATECLGKVVHHEVEVGLVLAPAGLLEEAAQPDDVLVLHELHHLELAVVEAAVEQHLRTTSPTDPTQTQREPPRAAQQGLFDRDHLAVGRPGPPHDAKGAIPDNLLEHVLLRPALPDGPLLRTLQQSSDVIPHPPRCCGYCLSGSLRRSAGGCARCFAG